METREVKANYIQTIQPFTNIIMEFKSRSSLHFAEYRVIHMVMLTA